MQKLSLGHIVQATYFTLSLLPAERSVVKETTLFYHCQHRNAVASFHTKSYLFIPTIAPSCVALLKVKFIFLVLLSL